MSRRSNLESGFQDKVIKYLNETVGGVWDKIQVSAYQRKGIADIIGCYKGRYIAIETKKEKTGRATKLQEYKLQRIKDNGGISMIIENLEQLKDFFDGFGD